MPTNCVEISKMKATKTQPWHDKMPLINLLSIYTDMFGKIIIIINVLYEKVTSCWSFLSASVDDVLHTGY